jgi:hypothetical protein
MANMSSHLFQDQSWVATPAESMYEYADNAGDDHPDQAWILTPFDVWMPNPHYHGPKVRHPEDDSDDGEF